MVASQIQRSSPDKGKGESTPSPSMPASRTDGASLRGMSFTEGEAALAPPENSALQLKRRGGGKGADEASAAPGAAPAAPGEMSPRDVLDSWDKNRVAGISVEWITALQTALGVPATGVSSRDLVTSLARLQAGAGKKTADGVLTPGTRKWLVEQFPQLAKIPQKSEAAGLQKAGAKGNAEAPEDEAVRLCGVAKGSPDYASQLKEMSFLGKSVVGHQEFLGRLANAQKYLSTKFPGQSEDEIGRTLGVIKTSHFRPSSKTSDQMYHGLGFALDINPVQNNWNFSNGKRGIKLSDVMKHVGDLFGESVIRGAGDMSKNARNGTTDELFEKLAASNDALRRYRGFATDKAGLEAFLSSDKAPPKAKSKGAAGWMKTIADDEKWLAKTMEEGTEDKAKGRSAGFMDFQKELIGALRDAGGLRWGGADLGGDNGDLMHFDGGTLDTARRLRNKTKDVRSKAAAAAKAEGPAPATPGTPG